MRQKFKNKVFLNNQILFLSKRLSKGEGEEKLKYFFVVILTHTLYTIHSHLQTLHMNLTNMLRLFHYK